MRVRLGAVSEHERLALRGDLARATSRNLRRSCIRTIDWMRCSSLGSRAPGTSSESCLDERDEAIRTLARPEKSASAARLRARLQLKAMLLRHGRLLSRQSS